jgi:hypothetical protein
MTEVDFIPITEIHQKTILPALIENENFSFGRFCSFMRLRFIEIKWKSELGLYISFMYGFAQFFIPRSLGCHRKGSK